MLRIAICDDETAARDLLRIQLEKVLVENTEEIVYEFSAWKPRKKSELLTRI